MSLEDEFFRWKEQAISASPPRHLFSYIVAIKCLTDSERCLNSGYYDEFAGGVIRASQSLQTCVDQYIPNHVQLIREYAELTKDLPEEALAPFVPLVVEMEQAAASGAKFVMAHLILNYGALGVFPDEGSFHENVTRQLCMIGAANEILRDLNQHSKRH